MGKVLWMSRIIRPIGHGSAGPSVTGVLVLVLRIVVFVGIVVMVVRLCGPGQNVGAVCESLVVLLPALAASVVLLTRGRSIEVA